MNIQSNICLCLWMTLVYPPPPFHPNTLDLSAAFIKLVASVCASAPVFSPAIFASCCLESPQGESMAAAQTSSRLWA